MKIEINYFKNQIPNANKLDVLCIFLHSTCASEFLPLKILLSKNDFKEIKDINDKILKQVFMTTDKNYYEIMGIGCVFCENIKDDEFIIITESSLTVEGKFSEIIKQINS